MSGRYLIAGMLVAVFLASAGLWWLIQSNLPSQAEGGEQLFAVNCAGCHGANAAGSDKGPTLISPIYRPGHHGDAAFQRAVREGVPQHHWFFGDMPPVAVRLRGAGERDNRVRSHPAARKRHQLTLMGESTPGEVASRWL